jgi:hypothetical protein
MIARVTRDGGVYKPSRFAWLAYAWDLAQIMGGVLLFSTARSTFASVAGVALCLFGLRSIQATRAVINTWIVVTDQHIAGVAPSGFWVARWRDLTSVVLRTRAYGHMPGRRESSLLLNLEGGRCLVFCPSVFTVEDEERLLTAVEKRSPRPLNRNG